MKTKIALSTLVFSLSLPVFAQNAFDNFGVVTTTVAKPIPAPLKCPYPQVTEAHRKTPVEVYIDQEKQLMYVKRPKRAGKAEIFSTRISTGGGLKIPNGINAAGKSPYCARTPSYKSKIIPAFKESDFDPTVCTQDEIRARATVFENYYTRTFSDSQGNPIPMPKAIRLDGGIFLHEVPPSYKGLLGENVSGECIRMNPTVAKQLFEEIMIHGAIKVTVSEPPAPHTCKAQYCDQKMIEKAKADIAAGRIPVTKRTGSEGLFGGTEGFFSKLACPNTQSSTPEEARKVFERLAKNEKVSANKVKTSGDSAGLTGFAQGLLKKVSGQQ